VSDSSPNQSEANEAGEAFFAGALHRIRRISVVLAIAGTIVVWLKFGVAIGAGFVIGCVVSYVNFIWLERVINSVADRVTQTGQAGEARAVVIRFMLRYGFIAIACFVILVCFKSSVYGLLGGLFLSVAAILCEAVYEGLVSVRKGI
jgi:hypothetical protein